MSEQSTPPKRTFRCSRCRCEIAWEGNPFRPFCSEKCRIVDLGRWAMEEYRVPGKPAEFDEQDERGKVIPFPEKD